MSADYPPEPTESPAPNPPARRCVHPLLAALAGAAIGAGAVGAAWATAGSTHASKKDGSSSTTLTARNQPQTFTLTGTFELTDDAVDDGASGCKGTGGYDDISSGTAVTVYDAAGTVIATGGLGDSTLDGSACTFDVAVEDVPKGKDFYKVEVSHRGTVQLTEAEAESGAFAASLG